MARITRRRALLIAAAACALPTLGRATPLAHWQGHALGAHAEIKLAGIASAEAAPLFAQIEAELDRLEAQFSLYRANSALARLNRDGRLDAPSPEMLELLSLARSVHHRTGGLFDPTIQPLFALHARRFATGTIADAGEIAAARALVGFDRVEILPARIAFSHAGMALTLNGIAQGFITDRIVELLRREGLRDLLVDIGEIRALGARPGGDGWHVGLSDGSRLNLRNRAIASSSLVGTLVNPAAGIGHIFNPARDTPAIWRSPPTANVVHQRAAVADAFSTAAVLAGPKTIQAWEEDGMKVIWS
ncbi:FAD:protein FMN transferase [Thioclava atlantica]|uniref:FAD:protein FMN transferase n=1 Tax=Thioclava atlantica TaxID=1317124 RepID=A0A085U0R5_9RHOB|nr:FAD:protein FMN transferase [Thioclava atlantica]KFE36562.1 ApbE family lipoprotein [Thioclava atlantica]